MARTAIGSWRNATSVLTRCASETRCGLLLLLSICGPSLPGSAIAQGVEQEPPPEAPPSQPQEEGSAATVPGGYVTVVTASRSELLRFESDRSIDVVASDRIAEAQIRSVPEAMDEVPGVHLQQTNRGAGTPILRGLVGPQNLILVDGIPITTSTHRSGPNQYLALFDPLAVRHVEVVRGPSSVLYGGGAMGGVVHLLTIDPTVTTGRPVVLGQAQTSFSSADLTRSLALRAERRGSAVAGALSAHLDWFDTLRAGGGADQPLSDYRAGYWQAKASWQPRPSLRLTAAYLGGTLRDTGRTDSAGKGDLRFYDDDDHLAYVVARRSRPGVVRTVSMRVFYHQLQERMRRYSCAATDGIVNDLPACFRLDAGQLTAERRYRDTVHVVGFDGAGELSLSPGRLVVRTGFDVRLELVGSDQQAATEASGFRFEAARGNFSDDSRYSVVGFFLQAEARLLELAPSVGRLQLTAGGRVSHVGAFAPEVEGLGDIHYEHEGVVGSVGLQLLRPGRHNAYLTFVQGFRPPNLQETTTMGDTGQKFTVPNADLSPERADTVEVGGKVDLGALQLDAACFYSRSTDAIVWEAATWQGESEIDGKPVIRMVNAHRGTFLGAEGSVGYRLWRFTVAASAAWIRGDIELDDGSTVPAQRVPPPFGRVAIRYDDPDRRFFVEPFLRWAAGQDRLHPEDEKDLRICETEPFSGVLETPCDGTPGWTTLNVRGAIRLDAHFAAYLQLTNLTDQRYRTHGSGFDAPGLDARVTLQATF